MTVTPETTTRRARRIPWLWIITLALAAGLLYFALRNIEWADFWAALQSARLELMAIGAVILFFSYLIRGLRWRVLLSAEKPIRLETAIWGTWVGYLGNTILPARAGEVIRTVIVSRDARLPIGFVLATALTERIMDAGILVLLLVSTVSALGTVPDALNSAARAMAVIAAVGIVGLLIAPFFAGWIARIIGVLPLPITLKSTLSEFVGRFLLGMKALRNPGRAVSFALLSAAAWGADMILAIIVAAAFGMTFSPQQALLLLAALGLGSALPSTPGYVGIYQSVATLIIVPFGYANELALAFIIAFQVLTLIMVIIFGGIGFVRLNTGGLRFTEIARRGVEPLDEAAGA